MKRNDEFEVRLSRLFLALMVFVGILFFYVGLDLLLLKNLFTSEAISEKPVLKMVFTIFALLVGSVLIVSQIRYIISPPLLFRVQESTFTFAVGMRYHEMSLSSKHVDSIQEIPKKGVLITLNKDENIPVSMATPMGILYMNHEIFLQKPYISKSTAEITSELQKRFSSSRTA